jgi:hypothetical protein
VQYSKWQKLLCVNFESRDFGIHNTWFRFVGAIDQSSQRTSRSSSSSSSALYNNVTPGDAAAVEDLQSFYEAVDQRGLLRGDAYLNTPEVDAYIAAQRSAADQEQQRILAAAAAAAASSSQQERPPLELSVEEFFDAAPEQVQRSIVLKYLKEHTVHGQITFPQRGGPLTWWKFSCARKDNEDDASQAIWT